MTKLLLGAPVAEQLAQYCRQKACSLGFEPTLAAVGTDNAQWTQYLRSLEKYAASFGARVKAVSAAGMTAEQMTEVVAALSAEGNTHGILVEQPLPPQYAQAVNAVACHKDVDCLSQLSAAKLYLGRECMFPATPLAVLKLLDYYNIELQGKNVVIVGRGNAVGKPLSLMMLRRNATVTVCHTKTVGLEEICRRAEVLVSACGSAGLITENHVTERSVVVDVGLSFVQGKTSGDVSDGARDIAAAVSPVPGGVGPVTRAALFCNLIEAAAAGRI